MLRFVSIEVVEGERQSYDVDDEAERYEAACVLADLEQACAEVWESPGDDESPDARRAGWRLHAAVDAVVDADTVTMILDAAEMHDAATVDLAEAAIAEAVEAYCGARGVAVRVCDRSRAPSEYRLDHRSWEKILVDGRTEIRSRVAALGGTLLSA